MATFTNVSVTDVLGNACQQQGGVWQVPPGQFNVFFEISGGPNGGTLVGIVGAARPPGEHPGNNPNLPDHESTCSHMPTEGHPNRWWFLGDNDNGGQEPIGIEVRIWPKYEIVDGHGSVGAAYLPQGEA